MVRKVNPTPGGRGDRGTVAALTFQFSFKGTCCISQTLKHVFFFLQSLLILPLSDKRLKPFHQLTCSVGTTGLAEKAFPEKLGQVQ